MYTVVLILQSPRVEKAVAHNALRPVQTPPVNTACKQSNFAQGGYVSQHAMGRGCTPSGRHPLGRQPPGKTPPRRQLKRVVRILLECILVNYVFTWLCHVLQWLCFEITY